MLQDADVPPETNISKPVSGCVSLGLVGCSRWHQRCQASTVASFSETLSGESQSSSPRGVDAAGGPSGCVIWIGLEHIGTFEFSLLAN